MLNTYSLQLYAASLENRAIGPSSASIAYPPACLFAEVAIPLIGCAQPFLLCSLAGDVDGEASHVNDRIRLMADTDRESRRMHSSTFYLGAPQFARAELGNLEDASAGAARAVRDGSCPTFQFPILTPCLSG